MNSVHVEAFDLNLLLVFDALWTERHVTRAARRIGLTQSAMSHALRRLRDVMADPLFQVAPAGLVPTARAHELAPPVAEALATVRRAVSARDAFVPAELTRTFTLGTSDYGDMVLLPRIMNKLRRAAPRAKLVTQPLYGMIGKALLSGEQDIMFALAKPDLADLRGELLFGDRFVSLLRADHPAAKQPLTLARFVALDHVLVSPQGSGEAVVDIALRGLGKARHIALRVPHFLTAPLVVANTDLIVTLPERVAKVVAPQHRLIMRKPPLELAGFHISMFWHVRNDADPAHRWLRELVASAAK